MQVIVLIVEVKFDHLKRSLFFKSSDNTLSKGQEVIAQLDGEKELGLILAVTNFKDNKKLNAKLDNNPENKILRLANQKDKDRRVANCQFETKASKLFEDYRVSSGETIKLIGLHTSLECKKLIVYYTAARSADSNKLVEFMSEKLNKKIELRQMGVIRESHLSVNASTHNSNYKKNKYRCEKAFDKKIACIGLCGRDLCCKSFPRPCDISKTMVDQQSLSLHPMKTSGCCNKLLCCLKYENEIYKELGSLMPKIGAHVSTIDGEEGTVLMTNILSQEVKLLLENSIKIYKLDKIKVLGVQ